MGLPTGTPAQNGKTSIERRWWLANIALAFLGRTHEHNCYAIVSAGCFLATIVARRDQLERLDHRCGLGRSQRSFPR
jgi:hypothetical protein